MSKIQSKVLIKFIDRILHFKIKIQVKLIKFRIHNKVSSRTNKIIKAKICFKVSIRRINLNNHNYNLNNSLNNRYQEIV